MRLLDSLPARPSLVDSAQLEGFVCACVNMRRKAKVESERGDAEEEEGEEEEEEEEEDGGKTVLERLEYCRISDKEVHVHMEW